MQITFTVYEDYNDNSVAELELPIGTENLLRKNGAHLIGDVVKLIEEDTLKDIKYMGATKQKDIKNALFNYELYVSPDPVKFIMNCKKVA